VNPHGDGRDARTAYAWHPTLPLPVLITAPTGEQTSMSYLSNGLLQWRQPGPDAARRDSVLYRDNGQVVAVIDALGQRDSVFYDALGNVAKTRTAKGFVTEFIRDPLGRDSITLSQIDTGAVYFHRTSTFYDAMGRVREVQSYGPPMTTGSQPIASQTQTWRLRQQQNPEWSESRRANSGR